METNNRRSFIKKSMLGLSGVALLPEAVKASAGNPGNIPQLPARVLGRTGINSPLISMGVGMSSDPNFIKAAYRSGIKLFFTASYYREGNNERLLGNSLKEYPRNSFYICTAADPDGFDGRAQQYKPDFSSDAYLQKMEGGLKRLELDYVDIFLLPMVCKRETILFDPVLKALKTFKEQGKTRFLGIATHDMCEDALYAAADAGIFDVIMIAYNYKVPNKENLQKAMDYAAKAGLGIIAMKTTAGAFRDKTRTVPINTDAALKWVLQNNNVSTIVSGMSNHDEMQKNLAMIQNLKMTDQEIQDLSLARLHPDAGLYCYQCRECLSQCPQEIDIPSAMRSYMYAYGYRDLAYAQYTLKHSGLPPNPCENCGTCYVRCSAGFDIKNKIQDIARLGKIPEDFIRV